MNIDGYVDWTEQNIAVKHNLFNKQYFKENNYKDILYFNVLIDQFNHMIDNLRRKRLSCLDVGCGACWIGVILSKAKIMNKLRYEGLDISEHMCRLARKNVPNAKFHTCDLLTLESKKKYNIVMMCGIIGLFDNWKDPLRKATEISNKWILIHKIIFTSSEKVPTKLEFITSPYNKKRKFIRNVINEADFTNFARSLKFRVINKISIDEGYPIYSVLLRKKK
jgi:SAM-dependent methyltransferase